MKKLLVAAALVAVSASGLVSCSSSTLWGAVSGSGNPIKYGDAYALCDTYKGEWGKQSDLSYMTAAQRDEARSIISQHEDCQPE